MARGGQMGQVPTVKANPSDLVDEIRRHARTMVQVHREAEAKSDAQMKPEELRSALDEAMAELRALSDSLGKGKKA
ncbi:MAG TPA: hypothetical protein VD902_04630 [Symbiobacteriaceae bacterium]|nr:hypothetical protein [Symbiobacteriaceae bacterium]